MRNACEETGSLKPEKIVWAVPGKFRIVAKTSLFFRLLASGSWFLILKLN
jgi:hypothetical protein